MLSVPQGGDGQEAPEALCHHCAQALSSCGFQRGWAPGGFGLSGIKDLTGSGQAEGFECEKC